jgi:glycosyltransferase involved in cell wall biosynthesis
VSVILTTHERPDFLPLALHCYSHQTYPRTELIVVDDGAHSPVARADVERVGGRLIWVQPGTPLGTKLNRGLSEARGHLCLKMDDDDWYAPQFLATMVEAREASFQTVCRWTVAGLAPFLFFDLTRWELRPSTEIEMSGGTLLFERDDWREHPFRRLPRQVDRFFVADQTAAGAALLRVDALETFLQLRHATHIWNDMAGAQSVDDYVRERPLYHRSPEAVLPDWAISRYRRIRDKLTSTDAR